jgi:hypothetical protein
MDWTGYIYDTHDDDNMNSEGERGVYDGRRRRIICTNTLPVG